ncbi:MAG: hypothetical protein DWI22_04090 [Planctomycetota bacterium]|nr:MAG: hypothetical protein DWI22_04090 [Planctomycetota bacterium]
MTTEQHQNRRLNRAVDNTGDVPDAAPELSDSETTSSLLSARPKPRISMAGAANLTHGSVNNGEHLTGRVKLLTASRGFLSGYGTGANCPSNDVRQFAEADRPPR